MFVRKFLHLTAITTFVIFILFFVFPEKAVSFFSDAKIINARVFVMFLGSSMLGYSLLNWRSASWSNKEALRAVFLANFTALAIATIITVYGLVSGALNGKGYIILGLHIFFGSIFLYLLLRKRSREE